MDSQLSPGEPYHCIAVSSPTPYTDLTQSIQDKQAELTLPESSLEGRWLMVQDEVNVGDITNSRPGAIIRMRHTDSLRYIPTCGDDFDRIAGMISDAA